MMTIQAIIKEGKVVPTEPLSFADGTKVTITPLELEDQEPTNVAELLQKFVGVIDNLPSDLSTNHDHYLYGVPKKKP